jgi:lysophospholipase L1-like esterase
VAKKAPALSWLLLLTMSGWLGAGEPAKPRICVEYLPAAVYEDDPISVCVRVEPGEGPASALRLTVSLSDEDGKALASDAQEGSPKAGAPWRLQSRLRPDDNSPAKLELQLAAKDGQALLSRLTVRVLSAKSPLPPLRVDGNRLVDESGTGVLVRVEHRIRKPQETWPFIRWTYKKIRGDGWSASRAVLIGEDLGAPKDGYLSQVANALKNLPTSVVAVGSNEREVGWPVLRAVAALARAKLEPFPDLAVISVGHTDPDFGTDVLQFGLALELLIQQLEARGCSHVILVKPLGPPHHAKRLAPFAKAVERVAFNYRARLADVASRLGDEAWAEGESQDRLLLRLPNVAGQRALAEGLASFVANCVR